MAAAVTQATTPIEEELELARSAAAACAEEKVQLARAVVLAEAAVEAKKADKAAGLREVGALNPAGYGEPAYWEKRFAKNRRGGEVYEWYVDYPGAALRQVCVALLRDLFFCAGICLHHAFFAPGVCVCLRLDFLRCTFSAPGPLACAYGLCFPSQLQC